MRTGIIFFTNTCKGLQRPPVRSNPKKENERKNQEEKHGQRKKD